MFWKVPAMPRFTTSQGAAAVMSVPLNTMRPLSGRRILVMSRSSVVLPAPFGPIRPTISSRASEKLTLLTAVNPPKRLVSFSMLKNSLTDLSIRPEVVKVRPVLLCAMLAQPPGAAKIGPMNEDDFLARAATALTGWANPAAHLREALDKDDFELYCQPMLAVSGAAAGSYPMGEVLVRLREEETALLPPGEFLPAFEHYRMMPELDRWVVRHAVKRLLAGSRLPC